MGCGSSAQKKYEEPKPKGDAAAAPPAEKPVEQKDLPPKEAAAVQAVAADAAGVAAKPAENPAPAPEAKKEAADPAAAPIEVAEPAAEPASKDDGESEGTDNEMDEAAFEAMIEKRASTTAVRQAVCAESVEKDENWVAPEHAKSEEQEARLKNALMRSFIFANLQPEELSKVIKAFAEFNAEEGQVVITQGAEVSTEEPALFVLEEGELDVYKNGVEGPVHTYKKMGDYFGDLALLYNAPRAATITAKTACKCWSVDRNTFNYLVKDAARQAKERRAAFLKDVPLLKSLNEEQVAALVDAFTVQNIEEGVEVIKEGDVGAEFYIVELGTLVATKGGEQVLTYETKGCFGELALIRKDVRAATVKTTSASRVLCLEQSAFERLLGGLSEEMQVYAKEKYG